MSADPRGEPSEVERQRSAADERPGAEHVVEHDADEHRDRRHSGEDVVVKLRAHEREEREGRRRTTCRAARTCPRLPSSPRPAPQPPERARAARAPSTGRARSRAATRRSGSSCRRPRSCRARGENARLNMSWKISRSVNGGPWRTYIATYQGIATARTMSSPATISNSTISRTMRSRRATTSSPGRDAARYASVTSTGRPKPAGPLPRVEMAAKNHPPR